MVIRIFNVLLLLILSGCRSAPMFIDMENSNILRGVAKHNINGTMTFTTSDSKSDLTCTGVFPFSMDKVVSGTITCNNGQTGKYIMNMNIDTGFKWRGEGSFKNGKTFRIFINYTSDPDKH